MNVLLTIIFTAVCTCLLFIFSEIWSEATKVGWKTRFRVFLLEQSAGKMQIVLGDVLLAKNSNKNSASSVARLAKCGPKMVVCKSSNRSESNENCVDDAVHAKVQAIIFLTQRIFTHTKVV